MDILCVIVSLSYFLQFSLSRICLYSSVSSFIFFSLLVMFLLSLYFIWVFWFCSGCILYDRNIVDAHMKINFKIHVKTHVARDILVLIRLLKPM